jgi:hypothetical protein
MEELRKVRIIDVAAEIRTENIWNTSLEPDA